MKHTPEPWKVWNHDGDACIEALMIEPDIYGDISTSLSFVNAKRIVACVNACAGMEDPAAELATLKEQRNELLDAIKSIYIGYVNALENGRDRIIALGGTCDEVEEMERTDHRLIAARVIIAKLSQL